ncbi:MAG: carboxymuconolactone decarboxylase family protein [Desulfobacteraceae bacterium]|nr:carboxymuconolactone decarboxylase family protein [Desulfobacteraceae bacterium]
MSVKIPLPKDADLPKDIQERLSSFPMNVSRMIANAPASFAGFMELASSILFKSEFDPRKREIAVLRVAHVTRADYEWTHHVTVAKRTGITDEEINKIASENPVSSLDEEGNLLCRVADEISLDVRLSDDALTQILDRYGIRGATELILCCSYFNMLSRFLESTRVELETEKIL